MKKQHGIMVIGLLAIAFGLLVEPGAALTNQEIVQGNAAFAWDLYAQLREGDGNLFFSPYSLSLALAMTYAGARGETAAQMAATLHFPGDQAEFHPAVAGLIQQVRETAETDGVELQIANSLWPDATFQLLDPFLEVTRQHYQANVFPVDFAGETEQSRQKINGWVSDHTMQKIPELLQPGDITFQTVLVLANAIYFKGNWDMPFKSEETADAPFTTPDGPTTVPMMHQRGDLAYAEDDGLQVLGLPYTGKQFYLVIFLPRQPENLDTLEHALNAEFAMQWIQALQPQKVNVTFPKFTLREHFSLLETLAKMGMQNVSDFSGLAELSPSISSIIHEAYVDVNEQGTEAAAATAVIMGRSLPRFVEFTADHPFVFCIVDVSSGSIVFIGRVMNPGGE